MRLRGLRRPSLRRILGPAFFTARAHASAGCSGPSLLKPRMQCSMCWLHRVPTLLYPSAQCNMHCVQQAPPSAQVEAARLLSQVEHRR